MPCLTGEYLQAHTVPGWRMPSGVKGLREQGRLQGFGKGDGGSLFSFFLFYVRVARMAGPLTQVQGLHHKMFCGGSPSPGAMLYDCEMMF